MSNQSIKTLQRFIISAGGKLPEFGVDGDLGNETKSAIESLQFPKYIKIALKEVGVKEKAGDADNPRIVEYHSTSAGKYSDDEIPWCGSFVNWCMKKAGYYVTVQYPERAKSWELFGDEAIKPFPGCIAVKSRSGGGHVCIVLGQDMNGNLLCVGGNQSDEVNIRRYKASDFYTFRKPLDLNYVGLKSYNLSTDASTKEA